MTDKQPEQPSDAAPDPPEEAPHGESDDADELDDVLDEFTPATTSSQPPPRAATEFPSKATAPPADAPVDTNALEEQMRKLLAGGAEGDDPEELAEMQEMLKGVDFAKELNDFLGAVGVGGEIGKGEGATAGEAGGAQPSGSDATADTDTAAAAAASAADASFQDTLRRTMQRLQQSDQQAGEAATAAGADPFGGLGLDGDALRKLMEDFQKNGAGGGSEEEMEAMLRSLLGEMTDREVLYEPMRELAQKYPGWLDAHGATLGAEERQRYERQSRRVAEIAAKFEEEGYADGKPECRAYIMERMEQMQEDGNHPEDLVGGLDATQQAFQSLAAADPGAGMDDKMGCPQQ